MDLNQVKKYGNIELLARRMVEGFITGLHKSPYHGFSVEFAEHRLYNSGESTKYIDWKVFARTDKLFVKTFEEETNLRCRIVMDISSSMFYPKPDNGKLTFSIAAAASLAYILQKQRDAVGLSCFSDKTEFETDVKSTSSHLHQIFLQLQQLIDKKEPEGRRTAAADALHRIAERMSRRSLIIIFSDMMDNVSERDDLFEALQHLKHRHHEVLLFHVRDKKTEEDFDFEDRPYRFVDSESGEEVKVQPSKVREYYQKGIREMYDSLKFKCGQYKIDFIEADIGQNIDQILVPYLIKRTKMR